MSEQDAKNKAAQISNTKNLFKASLNDQHQQPESTLIEMSKDDAKRTAVSNSK